VVEQGVASSLIAASFAGQTCFRQLFLFQLMGQPAARLTDMHVCPMAAPPAVPPHIGGPISGPGAPTVLIGGQPAARVGDQAVCTGPPDVIAAGSATVLIAGAPAARLGDSTAHGGSIAAGLPTVLIG
jgi:uncharacterized Zn-binding protein involved in type VI secretion